MYKWLITFIFISFQSINSGYAQVSIYTEEQIQNQNKFIQILQLKNQAKYDLALEGITTLVGKDPKNASFHFEQSRIHSILEDLENAVKSAEIAFDLDQNNHWFGEHLAVLYMDLERFEEAADTYAKIAELHPKNDEIHYKAAYCYLKANKASQALTVLNKLEKEIGIRSEISQKKFDIYSNIGKDKKAIAELEKLVKVYPSNTKFLYNLGSYLMQKGDKDKADIWFKKILVIDPEHQAAQMALKIDDSKAGSDISYLRSIKGVIMNRAVPLDNKIKELIPYVEKNAGLEDEALTAALLDLVNMLEKLHPAEAKVYAIKGDILFNAAKIKQANEAYIMSLGFNRAVFAVWSQVMHTSFMLADAEKLAAYSEQAIDFFPNQAISYYYHGKSYMLRQQFTSATSWFQEAQMIAGKSNPIRYDISNELAIAYIQIGNIKKASAQLVGIADDPIFRLHPGLLETAGDIEYYSDNIDGAIELWSLALKAGNQNPRLAEKIELKKIVK